MNDRVYQALVFAVLSALVSYVVITFVNWDWNIIRWSGIDRAAAVVIAVYCYGKAIRSGD